MASEADERALNGVLGRQIIAWSVQGDGMHIDLDDGKAIVLTGVFALAVFVPSPGVH